MSARDMRGLGISPAIRAFTAGSESALIRAALPVTQISSGQAEACPPSSKVRSDYKKLS
jgi:hypothetical protein